METEFFGLSLSRNELLELQTALIQRYIVEDELRREKGLEPIAHHGLLCRVDELLKLQNSELDKLTEDLDDELWEFSWFAFTEEWAWFKAGQEVKRNWDQTRKKSIKRRWNGALSRDSPSISINTSARLK